MSVSKKGSILTIRELNTGAYSHAEVLHSFIKEVLDEAGLVPSDLNAIAVSKGPGSYTGLRIGVSAAKGLCFSLQIPLISIDTLASLAHRVTLESGVVVPMLDARRMEVYSAVFNEEYCMVRTIKAEIIQPDSFLEYLESGTVYFVGDGAEKCKAVIQHPNAIFVDGMFPSAKEMCSLAYEKYKKNELEDVAYFEPFYLKDFLVVPQKKKI